MKETMTKLAVNFGPGEAFEVFVEHEQLGKAVAVLAGRWAEATVGSPCSAQPDPEALCEKVNAEADRRRGIGLADLMAKQRAPEAVCVEHEAFKRAKGEVCAEAKSGRRYRLSGDGWVVTFTHFNLVEVDGKLNESQLSDKIRNLGLKNGAEAIRECVRIALHFLKGRVESINIGGEWDIDTSPKGIEDLIASGSDDELRAAMFRLIRICDRERDKNIKGTTIEASLGIVDRIDTSQVVAIKPAPRTAHIAVSGTGWIVTYWVNGWVDICGTVDWPQFLKNLEKLASHADAAPSVRDALKVAWSGCMKLGLVSLSSMSDRQQSVIGPGFRFYKGPDAIWMERMDQSIVDEGCNIMHITNIVEALFTSTRMLADAAKKAAEPKLRTAHLRVFHDDWSVTYLDDGKVEFVGEPCWGRFGNYLTVAMERKEITSDQVRKAILFALVECSNLGLLDIGVTQPAGNAIYYGAYMRVYRHPDHVWLREDAYDLLARESAKIQQDKVVEVLTIVTRMLGGAK